MRVRTLVAPVLGLAGALERLVLPLELRLVMELAVAHACGLRDPRTNFGDLCMNAVFACAHRQSLSVIARTCTSETVEVARGKETSEIKKTKFSPLLPRVSYPQQGKCIASFCVSVSSRMTAAIRNKE
jgi:hypothetical protein